MSWSVKIILAAVLLAAISIVIGSVIVVSHPFETVRAYLDKLSGDGSADSYTQPLHLRLQIFAGVLGLVSLVVTTFVVKSVRTKTPPNWIVILDRSMLRFHRDRRALIAECSLGNFRSKVTFALLGIIATICYLASRVPFLDIPIRFDEAISWRDYASKPIWMTVSLYGDPNNHIFHNLLTHVFLKLFGESLLVLRLTSLISGWLATVIAVWSIDHLVQRFADINSIQNQTADSRSIRLLAFAAGLTTAFVLAVHESYREFTVYSRGYSVIALTTVLIQVCLYWSVLKKNYAAWLLAGFMGAFGLWTIPTFLYALIATAVIWSIIAIISDRSLSWQRLQSVVSCFVFMISLALVLYLPVLLVEGTQALFANRYVSSLSSSEWFARIGNEGSAAIHFIAGTSVSLAMIMTCASVLTACVFSIAFRKLCALVLIACLTILITISLQRVLPPDRTWTPFIIPWTVLVVTSIALNTLAAFQQTDLRPHSTATTLFQSITFVALGSLCFYPHAMGLWHNPFQTSNRLGRCDSAEASIETLIESNLEQLPIIAVCPASGTLDWYAKQRSLPDANFFLLTNERNTSVIVAVVNDSQFQQTVESVLATYYSSSQGEVYRDLANSLGGSAKVIEIAKFSNLTLCKIDTR